MDCNLILADAENCAWCHHLDERHSYRGRDFTAIPCTDCPEQVCVIKSLPKEG